MMNRGDLEPDAVVDSGSDAAAEKAIKGLGDLPDELIGMIYCSVSSDLCAGVASLVRLAAVGRRLRCRVHDWVTSCAQHHGISLPPSKRSPQRALELLSIIEAVAGLGTNRIYFKRAGRSFSHNTPQIRPGSSQPRLMEFAVLLRRHPQLCVAIEGHESTAEGATFQTEDGLDIRVSHGASQRRADAVRDGLLELECLVRVAASGARVWGSLPSRRFGERITRCRGWEDAVAEAAAWESGALGTCHAEVFFTFDGVEVPSRPAHYAAAQATRDLGVGWVQYAGSSSGQADASAPSLAEQDAAAMDALRRDGVFRELTAAGASGWASE